MYFKQGTDVAYSNGNTYEIGYSSLYLWAVPESLDKHYYVRIWFGLNEPGRDGESHKFYNSHDCRRFESREEAVQFCEAVDAGKFSYEELHAEQQAREALIMEKHKALTLENAQTALYKLDELGISYDKALKAFGIIGGLSMECRDICSVLSKERKDPEKLLQENIVNIAHRVGGAIDFADFDLDHIGGFTGLTGAIIEAAKRFDREIGRKTDWEDYDSPDYWEAIDDFTDDFMKTELGYSPDGEHAYDPEQELDLQSPMTLGAYMDALKADIQNITLVTGENHSTWVQGISHFSPNSDKQYSEQEVWLRSLPVRSVSALPNNAYLATPFTMDQLLFLLDQPTVDQELKNLCFRSKYAHAGFNDRLAYLEHGTPFERPFDINCMDAKDPFQRSRLADYLARTSDVLVTKSLGSLAPYTVDSLSSGVVFCNEFPCSLVETEPGKGLASTIEGKMLLASQKRTEKKVERKTPEKEKPSDLDR